MARLVYTYNKLGKWKEAEELGLDVVKRLKRVLGVDHTYTLHSMSNLVFTYEKLGKRKDAKALSKTIEEIRKVCGNFNNRYAKSLIHAPSQRAKATRA